MKKLLLVVAAALGASILKKNIERSKTDKDLWAEATAPKADSGEGDLTPTAPAS
ncbi:MAG: DLW-39 family protein [Dermatophilaceae bacterium]